MYMAPLARSRPVSSIAARRLVGALALLLSVAMVAPWLAVNAFVSAIVIGGLAIGRGPRALLQAIDHAGEVALGR